MEYRGPGIQRFLLAFFDHSAAMTDNDRKTLARSCPSVALRFDFQRLATMLAVNRIRFVAAQAAFWAFMLDLGWLEDGTCQLHK